MYPMKIYLPILGLLFLISCDHQLRHERIVFNNTLDTITVFNPDFNDTVYTILPGTQSVVYKFENLDTKQEMEPCRWLGDTLIIKSIHDSVCTKISSFEWNWFSQMGGTDKARVQTCTFTIEHWDIP